MNGAAVKNHFSVMMEIEYKAIKYVNKFLLLLEKINNNNKKNASNKQHTNIAFVFRFFLICIWDVVVMDGKNIHGWVLEENSYVWK